MHTIAQKFLDRCEILRRGAPALIFPRNNILERDQIIELGRVVVSPALLVRAFRLETPDAAELRRTHLAFAPVLVAIRPYVLTAHDSGILHEPLKDAARLLGYFIATAVAGALLAPWLFWSAHALASRGVLPWLAKFDFESFFHRALLIAAVAFIWPLLRATRIRARADLGLQPNARWGRDLAAGFGLAAVPLLFAAAGLLASAVYENKSRHAWNGVATVVIASLIVPLIEESLFRGVFFGILARVGERTGAVLTSALFAIVHFLKAPSGTSATPSWYSGFVSIAHAFEQFQQPMMLLAGFCTLFLIGCSLAHARIATKSLWLPIGLHAGWILVAGLFGKFARRQAIALPWIGNNLLVGLVPLITVAATWALMILWFRYARARSA